MDIFEKPSDYLNYKEDPDNKDFEKAYNANLGSRTDSALKEFEARLFDNGQSTTTIYRKTTRGFL